MLRKITVALVAAVALGTAALIPTSASAWVWYNGWGGYYTSWYGWAPTYSYMPVYADSIASCARHRRSYDPASGTFLGRDGFRHYCW
jgi:BA14K-like protein